MNEDPQVEPARSALLLPERMHQIAGKPVELMEGLIQPMDDGAIIEPLLGSVTIGLTCLRACRPYAGSWD